MPEVLKEPPPAAGDSAETEELSKMSFGDHLDELRRRMVWCAATLFVCVGVMMPFKKDITRLYLEPYAIMWAEAYEEWLTVREAEYDAAPGPKDPQARLAAALFLTKEVKTEILGGDYPDRGAIQEKAGFPGPYPQKADAAAWRQFEKDFATYATSVRWQRDRIEQLIWHRERRDEILAGDFDDMPDLIYTDGGFPLPKNLKSTKPLEDFWTFMAACILFACMIASPVLLWHMWAFIAAGLYKRERAVVHRSLPFAIGLLVAGVAFGFFIMVPYAFYFLAQMMDWTEVGPLFTVAAYFKFLLTLTVALGMVFQLPILMVALQKVGVLTLSMMTKNWRWVVMGFFLVSAMLTPPDPVTQILMVTPMLSLFLLGLFLMWRVDRKQRRALPVGATAS